MSGNNGLFVQASRKKLRFATNSGHVSTEDLWDLSLKDLDRLAVGLHTKITSTRLSFLENPDRKEATATAEEQLRFDILRVVIDTKQAENKAANDAKERRQRREMLLQLREKQETAKLESLTPEEIDKALADLEAEEKA